MRRARALAAISSAILLALVVPTERPANAQMVAQVDVSRLPEGPNRDVVARKCSTCHALSNLTSTVGRTRERWDEKVNDMVTQYGLVISPAERALVLDYLATALPP